MCLATIFSSLCFSLTFVSFSLFYFGCVVALGFWVWLHLTKYATNFVMLPYCFALKKEKIERILNLMRFLSCLAE